MTRSPTTVEPTSETKGCGMFATVMTYSGAVVGLLVLAVMVVTGILVDSEQTK